MILMKMNPNTNQSVPPNSNPNRTFTKRGTSGPNDSHTDSIIKNEAYKRFLNIRSSISRMKLTIVSRLFAKATSMFKILALVNPIKIDTSITTERKKTPFTPLKGIIIADKMVKRDMRTTSVFSSW